MPRGSTKSIDDDDVELPDQVKYAASMSHIQRLALNISATMKMMRQERKMIMTMKGGDDRASNKS